MPDRSLTDALKAVSMYSTTTCLPTSN